MISRRISNIEESPIRKIFDLAAKSNNFINLSTVQRISHGKAYDNDNEIQCFNIEFVYHDGTAENHEMTYEEFQQLVEKCDAKMAFVVDDYINSALSQEIC